jgi:hypothetical protein
LGNPDIRPERASELEIGADFTLSDNIASVEVTYFRKYIVDMILSRALPISSGYSSIFENSGEMENNGFEAAVNLNAVRTENFSWSPRFNFYTNLTKITKLTVPPFNSGGFGAGYGSNRIQEGLSATALFGRSNLGPRFMGDTVRAGVYNGTTPEGDVTPLFQVGFANSMKFGNLDFYFLIDWRQGGSVVNLTQALYVEGGLWNNPAQAAEILRIAGTRVIDGGRTPYIQDGSFVKIREVSLNYTFDKAILAGSFLESLEFIRVGLSGRNLFMFTNYQGYDPEVSNFGNQITAGGQDVAPFPSSRSYFFNLAFGL